MNSARNPILLRLLLLCAGSLGSQCGAGTAPIQVQILSPTNGVVLRAHQQSTVAASVIALDGFVPTPTFLRISSSVFSRPGSNRGAPMVNSIGPWTIAKVWPCLVI